MDERDELREVDGRGGEGGIEVDAEWDAVFEESGEGALVGGGIDGEGGADDGFVGEEVVD